MRGLRVFGVLLLALPLFEIFAFVEIGSRIGALTTVVLVIAGALAGGVLMARHGRTMVVRLQSALAAGRPPAYEMIDGTLAWFGALFLLVPGFVTDGIGLLLLLPPLRRLVAIWSLRRMFVVSASANSTTAHERHTGPRVIETDWRRDDEDR